LLVSFCRLPQSHPPPPGNASWKAAQAKGISVFMEGRPQQVLHEVLHGTEQRYEPIMGRPALWNLETDAWLTNAELRSRQEIADAKWRELQAEGLANARECKPLLFERELNTWQYP